MSNKPRIFLISDTHFGNANIIKYCDRPFNSVEEMDAALISNWNAAIGPDDIVYHLGDFIMGDPSNIHRTLPQLNGKITLVRGNHDTESKLRLYADYGIDTTPFTHFSYKGLTFILCHFPVFNDEFLELVTQDNAEIVICFGHVHNKAPFYNHYGNQFNLSADVTNFCPVSIDNLVAISRPRATLAP